MTTFEKPGARSGIEPEHRTPTVVLYDEPHALVERIAPATNQSGDPVLLVTPLAVRSPAGTCART